MSYIAVIGAGSWGTTLAAMLAEREHDVSLWAHEKEVADEIVRTGINTVFLPGVVLPGNLTVTSDLAKALSGARYVLNVVPTQYVRTVFRNMDQMMGKDAVIVSASKGIEQGTMLTVTGILKQVITKRLAVLSGPSFAREVIQKMPTAVTLAAEDSSDALLLQEIFNTNYFRVYTHDDMLGIELGGALKNVIAIASGISDGLKLGHDARAALITRGLAEIMRLGDAMGADRRTFTGLSGLGDLVLTCTGPLSRNYSVGVRLGEGMKLHEITSSTKSVAEGVATAQSAYDLSRKFGVDMPIVEQVHEVIYKAKNPESAVKELMNRALRSEF